MFVSALVPLEFKIEGKSIWTNSSPGGTKFLRPIRILFAKESATLTVSEYSRIESQIPLSILHEVILDSELKNIHVDLKYQYSMCDGKVINALVGNNATSRCPVCRKTSKHFMGDTPRPAALVDDARLMTISVLHTHIRALEFFLQLGYKVKHQADFVNGRLTKKDFALKITDRKREGR